jgi:hypothetical protein
MGHIGKTLAMGAQFSIYYGESLLKDVRPDIFARHPLVDGKRIITNHPAWVYGHLSVYASHMATVMGLDLGPCAKPAGWDELFKNGTECKDDPTGSIYPPMPVLSEYYLNSYRYLHARLPEVSDDVLLKPNPGTGRFAEMVPTVAGLVCFLTGGHAMSHLGQVSTWRRVMGLGPA